MGKKAKKRRKGTDGKEHKKRAEMETGCFMKLCTLIPCQWQSSMEGAEEEAEQLNLKEPNIKLCLLDSLYTQHTPKSVAANTDTLYIDYMTCPSSHPKCPSAYNYAI